MVCPLAALILAGMGAVVFSPTTLLMGPAGSYAPSSSLKVHPFPGRWPGCAHDLPRTDRAKRRRRMPRPRTRSWAYFWHTIRAFQCREGGVWLLDRCWEGFPLRPDVAYLSMGCGRAVVSRQSRKWVQIRAPRPPPLPHLMSTRWQGTGWPPSGGEVAAFALVADSQKERIIDARWVARCFGQSRAESRRGGVPGRRGRERRAEEGKGE